MTHILTALYNGDIHPAEDWVKKTPEHKRLDDEFMRASDAFSDRLEKELAEEYERLIDAHTDLLALQEAESYVRGMKLGARMMLELMEEYK